MEISKEVKLAIIDNELQSICQQIYHQTVVAKVSKSIDDMEKVKSIEASLVKLEKAKYALEEIKKEVG